METKTGWRATPAPLLLAFAVWAIYMVVRIVVVHTASFDRLFSQRLHMTSAGISVACTLLALLGTLELMKRSAGSTRTMLKVAMMGMAVDISTNVLVTVVQFSKNPWDHKWVYEVSGYVGIVAWLMFAVGITLATPAARRMSGFVAVALTAVVLAPRGISETLWGVTGLEGKALYTVEMLVRLGQIVVLVLAVTKVSDGTPTVSQPAQAAEAFRTAGRGLWLRVIAACVVMMFTLMMIAGKGHGSVPFFKLIMMGQALVTVIALLMTGLGALRAARSGVPGLEPITLALGGGASLWAAGVSLAQVPLVYKAFYADSDGYGRSEMQDLMSVLSVALPIVVILGVGLLATALSGFAARRGNEELRAEAQGKGIGYVVLLLVAIAIQTWMVPMSRSLGNFAMLSLLSAGASLWGTIMMAKLFGRAAEILESEPGLPQASVVSDASGL